jgi:hypothetical protein
MEALAVRNRVLAPSLSDQTHPRLWMTPYQMGANYCKSWSGYLLNIPFLQSHWSSASALCEGGALRQIFRLSFHIFSLRSESSKSVCLRWGCTILVSITSHPLLFLSNGVRQSIPFGSKQFSLIQNCFLHHQESWLQGFRKKLSVLRRPKVFRPLASLLILNISFCHCCPSASDCIRFACTTLLMYSILYYSSARRRSLHLFLTSLINSPNLFFSVRIARPSRSYNNRSIFVCLLP